MPLIWFCCWALKASIPPVRCQSQLSRVLALYFDNLLFAVLEEKGSTNRGVLYPKSGSIGESRSYYDFPATFRNGRTFVGMLHVCCTVVFFIQVATSKNTQKWSSPKFGLLSGNLIFWKESLQWGLDCLSSGIWNCVAGSLILVLLSN